MAVFGKLGKKKKGVLPYVLLLVLAIIVLFFIAYMSFRQNRALRSSTELVGHTQEVINEVNMLFGNYMGSESAGIKYLLSQDSTYLSPIQGFKDKSDLSTTRLQKLFSDNKEQQERLAKVPDFSEQLFKELRTFDPETSDKIIQTQTFRNKVNKIEGYLDSLETIKSEMIATEYELLEQRRQDYESEVTLTPINILYSSLFALGILMFAFSKINMDRKQMRETRKFLDNVLSSLQSVVSYFEAVRDDNGKIKDFRVAYHNIKIKDLTGATPQESEGKLISELYPFLLENGDYERYVETIETEKPQEYEQGYEYPKGDFTFCNEVARLNDGVTVVSQDITLRKQAEKKLEEASERLALQNTVLNDAESVAGLGSCSFNLTTDEIIYSDNCYRLLGMEPMEKAESKNLVLSSVHPDDKERFEKNTALTIEQKKSVRDVYLIKNKQGDLKNVMMQSHYFEKNGEGFMVGVLRDITKEVTDEIILRNRNRALERSNAELESFNRVASHDLQEPLRKVQMFISRLTDFEKNKLSKKGISYLEKIESSANRMQHLIRNLLSFSKIADESATQEKVDLNLVFTNVLEDLSESIQETGAEITLPELPVINGTGFQLEQLFANLISNSLKYKKLGQTPEIKISSEVLPYDKIGSETALPRSKYLRITVNDNGIGFDQHQSGKIFQLFERLHAKKDYSGTGLGLAICKKIVDNHQGHIAAFGKHNEGTRIEVYLPYPDK